VQCKQLQRLLYGDGVIDAPAEKRIQAPHRNNDFLISMPTLDVG
jgi:hypothetical protein